MNHHLNDNELVLALDGEMEEAELKRAVDHLAECDSCRERWERMQGLSARVAEYATALYAHPVAHEQNPRDKGGARLFVRAKVSSFGFRVPSWGWGLVAAVVLVGVSVGLWNGSHSNAHPIATVKDPTGQVETTVAHASLGNAHPIAHEQNPHDKGGARLSGHRPKVNHAAPSAQQNAAKQFTELPFSNAALPLDQATVVRVTLPAAALRQAGVPVNEDNADAMLQADVVLGMDGLPRGIRLVTSGSSGTTN